MHAGGGHFAPAFDDDLAVAAIDSEDDEGSDEPAGAMGAVLASAGAPGLHGLACAKRRPGALALPDALELVRCMHAIGKRDERALQALYQASGQRVFASVMRVVRQSALAEEVVMDTYFQVWRQAALYDAARGQVLTWLLSIARSRAIDALRRQARFQHQPLDDEAAATSGGGTVPDEQLQGKSRHAALQRALMALQAQPRQLVALAYFRGLTHEEIAQQTQLPLGTVKSQLRRALCSLQQLLQPAAQAVPAAPAAYAVLRPVHQHAAGTRAV